MYKVFFNDREIIISQKPDITLNKSQETRANLSKVNDVKDWFLQFVQSDENKVLLLSDSPESFWGKTFVKAFRFITASGGVVVRDNKIMVIFRNEKWDLPKGKIDRGESAEIAAIREVQEECGISGHKIVKKLPSTYHIYRSPYKKSKGEWILKETFWFEMAYSGLENGYPQTEENITEIRWLSFDELDLVLENTYENLKQILELYRD